MRRCSGPFPLSIYLLLVVGGCAVGSTPSGELEGASPIPSGELAPSAGEVLVRPRDGMAMVFVPGGEFVMGSDEEDIDSVVQLCNEYRTPCERDWFADEMPAHKVTLGDFWIDRTEVTNAQYERCVEEGGCTVPVMEGSHSGDVYYGNTAFEAYPVTHVLWNQAQAYCAWVGAQLPTEAEWEYAARGPEGSVFPWGNEFDGNYVNYCDASCEGSSADGAFDDGYITVAPVGRYPQGASWCGALDMAGNVREYVVDWYDVEYYSRSPVENPQGAEWGRGRVVRGGWWGSGRSFVRSAYRHRDDVREVVIPTGIRCVVQESP